MDKSETDGKGFIPDFLKLTKNSSEVEQSSKKGIQVEEIIKDETCTSINKQLEKTELDYNLYYNLNDGRLKKAIIFNHSTYSYNKYHKTPSDRKGTEKDCKRINKCLQNLGFVTKVYNNPKLAEIVQIIKDASLLSSSEVSCLIIVVMTHGDIHDILHADDMMYPKSTLFQPFINTDCKLIGVPKLFFIQACRGEQVDEGRMYTDGEDSEEKITKIPTFADFVIMYSTTKDQVSWRERYGTWFIQSLCEELEKNYKKWDLVQLLTFVNRRVAFDFQSNTYDESDLKSLITHGKKQMPMFESTLTKLLLFSSPFDPPEKVKIETDL